MNPLCVASVIAHQQSELAKRQMTLEFCQDFANIPEIVKPTGRVESPMLGTHMHDFTKSDAYWLILKHESKVIGGQAARFYNLGDEPLIEYVKRTSIRHYQRSEDPVSSFDHRISEKD